ncbi:MAG: hypothetical protein AAFV53_40665, partial [Myxococcota bacterium]
DVLRLCGITLVLPSPANNIIRGDDVVHEEGEVEHRKHHPRHAWQVPFAGAFGFQAVRARSPRGAPSEHFVSLAAPSQPFNRARSVLH